ncbi:MAG: LCP family protein, partial [Ilumatobacteraceae bacterium]
MASSGGSRSGLAASIAAALCSVIMPGAGHVLIRARLRPAVIVAAACNIVATTAVVAIVAPVDGRSDLADVIANRTVFLGLAVTLVVLAATRLWSALDAAWIARPSSRTAHQAAAAIAVGVVVLAGVAPLAVAANYVWQTDRAVEKVFSSDAATTANPSPLTTTVTTAAATSATTTTMPARGSTTSSSSTSSTSSTSTTTTMAVFPGEERVNVLLLGGDGGPDRWSMRTDSMIVVSIDPDTGDTAMISVPRNLRRLPFPPGTPLAERYPKGFDEIANAVYTRVDSHRELAGGVDDAGAQGIKQGIAQLLGMPIHYYVLVDMAGFVDVVDALGGIDINVAKRVPSVGRRPDEKHPVPKWFEPGLQHMD